MEFDYAEQTTWPQISGKMQSPVDLVMADAQPERWAGLKPALRGNVVVNTPHNLQVRGGGLTEIGGRVAIFDHLHFHAPAEHLLDGKKGVMEAHFVHTFSDGQPVVVSVPLRLGESNPVMAAVLAMTETPMETPISLNGLLPATTNWYHYLGSLTTPPVVEGVAWYVAARSQTISADQLAAYQNRYPEANERAVQPLNERKVLLLHQ